ncbi:MAG: DUF1302 family protein [bacterium]
MNHNRRRVVGVLGLLLSLGLLPPAEAVDIDKAGTLTVSAKAQTRLSVRLEDAEGFTNPDVSLGDIVQHRNLVLLEVNHDLNKLRGELDLLYPFRALDIDVKYRLLGRFLYEGIYDYGPEIFRDVADRDPDNIDSFKQSYDLWEAYVDFSRGPVFLRVGRQIAAWGETDIFRLLDYINPLDNTFGGPFEDLDDRRIPLWMLLGNCSLGSLGPVSSLTVEGFWVPGPWDARVAPWAPDGTPYEVPLADTISKKLIVHTPEREMSNSRWGVRLQGLVANQLNMSIGHFQTFLDLPAVRTAVTTDSPVLLDLNDVYLEGLFPSVQISGGSASYFEPHVNAVFRGEVAWFWDEPVLILEKNLDLLFGPNVPLPQSLIDSVGDLYDLNLTGLGLTGLPLNPHTASVPKKDILRYMIGLDKQVWVRPLNATTMFFVSLQYFGQWVPDYDKRMRQPLNLYPEDGNTAKLYGILDFAAVRETEHVFTAIINTAYRKGTVTPQVAVAYDVRGTWLVQPSVNIIREPFRFMVQYSAIEGQFTNFGAFRDRDQISFILSYLLN